MILGLLVLLGFQLVGEVAVRWAGVPVPGPVLGLALCLGAISTSARVAAAVAPVARTLLAHLSLLFVPAGVGVVGHLDTLGSDGLAVLAAIVVSTVAALVVAVWVFVWVRDASGAGDD